MQNAISSGKISMECPSTAGNSFNYKSLQKKLVGNRSDNGETLGHLNESGMADTYLPRNSLGMAELSAEVLDKSQSARDMMQTQLLANGMSLQVVPLMRERVTVRSFSRKDLLSGLPLLFLVMVSFAGPWGCRVQQERTSAP